MSGGGGPEPHDPRAEHDVLWLAMRSVARRRLLVRDLSADDFFLSDHEQIYRAIAQLDSEHPTASIDARMVAERLPGASAREIALAPGQATWQPDEVWERHTARLRQLSECRRLHRACLESAARALDPATVFDPGSYLDWSSQRILEAVRRREAYAESSTLDQLADGFGRELVAGQIETGRRIAMPLHALARIVRHLESERLYVIGGRPGTGKSSLAVQLAFGAAQSGERVLVYSLEMSTREIRDRILAAASHVPLQRVIDRTLNAAEQGQLIAAAERCSAAKGLEIVSAKTMRLEDILRHARREHALSRVGLVVVDYLQLLTTRHRYASREEAVANMSRELKLLAGEMQCPVIAVAQLNRESEKRINRRPQLSDLRESGAIEQDADVVIFVHRDVSDEAGGNRAEIVVAKQRSGPPGSVVVRYHGELTWFGEAIA